MPIDQPLDELGFDNFVAAIAGRAAYIKALKLPNKGGAQEGLFGER